MLWLFLVGLDRCVFFGWKLVGVDGCTTYKSPMQKLYKSKDFSFLMRVKIIESPLLWFQYSLTGGTHNLA